MCYTILDLLISISENVKKIFFGYVCKNRLLPYRGGVLERYGHVRNF